jgi:hypothetical protein
MLGESMTKEMFLEQTKNKDFTITFTKKNGEQRVLNGSFKESNLPVKENKEESKTKRKVNPDIISVFDLEIKQWRSFNINSLVKLKVK